MSKTILRIDSSPRGADSISRQFGDKVIEKLVSQNEGATVVSHDISNGLPVVNGMMIASWFTPEEARTPELVELEAISSNAIQEIKDADMLVITVPMWNFSIPAQLKGWIDLIVRTGISFGMTEEGGYVGLLEDKPVYIVMATGGIPAGSEMDGCSTYLVNTLGFLGLTSSTVIAADGLQSDEAQALANAQAGVDAI